MKCWICQTEMIKLVQDEEWSDWGNPPINIPKVISWICPNIECDHKIYDTPNARKIENAMRRIGEFEEK